MTDSSSNPITSVSPGHIVGGGHYSLHVPLSDGNLLWLAQDEEKQRLAVVRFLPVELRQDERVQNALRDRVLAACKFQHPNVGRMLEWYESPGVETFVAAEYVEGQPLLQALGGGAGQPVSWPRLQPWASRLAAALDALHQAGLVHQGVRPENLLVAPEQQLKLINTAVTGLLKNPLVVPGVLQRPAELRCFSPQQLAGQPPTPADDFYGLGSTLFELLTGRPVFPDAATLVMDLQSTPAPSLREVLAAAKNTAPIPEAVLEFIQSCLSKDPQQRPKSFATLLSLDQPTPPQPVERVQPVEDKPRTALARFEPVEMVPAERLSRADLELIKQARDARPRRGSMLLLVVFLLMATLAGAAGYLHLQKKKQEQARLAAQARQEAAQRAEAEQAAREAQARLEAEKAARAKSEEEARLAREAAEKAEARRQAEIAELTRRQQEEKAAAERAAARKAAQLAAEASQPKFIPPPQPSSGTAGFISLFNGRDLQDWSGDTNHWSVRDGFITARARAGDPKERHLLLWQKGEVTDFELRFSYRFRVLRGNKSPNGGVNYRLGTNNSCYQFDLVTNPRDNGSISDDHRRNRLAGYGESTIGTSSNKYPVVAALGDTNQLNRVLPEDWNQGVIIAKGHRLTHYLNGTLVADVLDESKSKRHSRGAIALELYPRNTNNGATFLQFSDLMLKTFEGGDKGTGLAESAPAKTKP